jgi:hypothetical protein
VKTLTKNITINTAPEKVFAYMDNLSNTGMHMMESSSMMMRSKLNLEQLSPNAIGLNSKFRWYGKMMGMKMDFTVIVTKWVEAKEKVWETFGEARMIIIEWYRMRLVLTAENQRTKAELSIEYTKPKNIFLKLIAWFLAPLYASWCLNSMLNDSKKHLESSL